MRFNMPHQVRFRWERLLAILTYEGPFTCMYPCVVAQSREVQEPLVADAALVGPLARVCRHVSAQVHTTESLPADVALVGSLPRVDALVRLQRGARRE